MSDSTESAFSFLHNWKFGLAVCVPCFAVGLGVTYYYYSKTPGKTGHPVKGASLTADKSVVINVENGDVTAASTKSLETDGISKNPSKNSIKVSKST